MDSAAHVVVDTGASSSAGPAGGQDLHASTSVSAIEVLEEYGLLALVVGAVLVFFLRRAKTMVEDVTFEASVRKREDSMRKIREMQQARYEVETAEQRARLAAVEEERRKQKLEEMQAMAEGRTAKHKKEQAKGRIDTQDFWDNTEGFNPLNGGGGGGGSFKPTCRCGLVSDRERVCVRVLDAGGRPLLCSAPILAVQNPRLCVWSRLPGTVGESNADHDVLCFAGDAADEGNDAVGDRCELYATCLPPTAGRWPGREGPHTSNAPRRRSY